MTESEKAKGKRDICLKDTGTEANASPTLGFPECLDATKHAQNLMDLREKRVETTEIENPANDARKGCSDNGDKQSDDYSSEYPMVEGKRRTPRADESESNPNPSPLNQ